jgi:hypothetical protein
LRLPRGLLLDGKTNDQHGQDQGSETDQTRSQEMHPMDLKALPVICYKQLDVTDIWIAIIA